MASPLRSALLAGALATALVATGCGDGDSGSGGGKLRVVTTVAPLTSIVAAVGGDHVVVEGLVPEGTNSHTWEPPPSAAKTIAGCDLVFANGLGLEEATTALAEANAPDGCKIVKLGDAILPREKWIFDFSFPEKDGKPNPHLWTNPLLALQYAALVRGHLASADKDNADAYRANYEAFQKKLRELHSAMSTATATVPAHQRALLTYHDGYAYFARDYGWRIVGAIQPSNFEDPTPREVARIIEQVRREKVPAIFGSEVFPSKVLETIGKETGARYVDTLRDDDLPGSPGAPEHSWLGLMRTNFVTMVTALGGNASALQALTFDGLPEDKASYPQ